METIYENYLTLAPNADNNTHLRVSLNYDRDPWYGQQRGYYLSVIPVQRDSYFERAGLFSGYKKLVHPVQRKSKKAETIAIENAADWQQKIIDTVLSEHGYELA